MATIITKCSNCGSTFDYECKSKHKYRIMAKIDNHLPIHCPECLARIRTNIIKQYILPNTDAGRKGRLRATSRHSRRQTIRVQSTIMKTACGLCRLREMGVVHISLPEILKRVGINAPNYCKASGTQKKYIKIMRECIETIGWDFVTVPRQVSYFQPPREGERNERRECYLKLFWPNLEECIKKTDNVVSDGDDDVIGGDDNELRENNWSGDSNSRSRERSEWNGEKSRLAEVQAARELLF